MSKSLDYCRAVAADKNRSKCAGRDWNKAVEVESKPFFEQYCSTDFLPVTLDLELDPEADFQYFTSASCISDGTLRFTYDLFKTCVQRVFNLQTWNKNISPPKNGDRVKMTVGNFVMLDEYGQEFAPEDKPWMTNRTTVLLPLKIEVFNQAGLEVL